MSIMKATVDPLSPGSRLDADHPENGVLIPRRFTAFVREHSPDTGHNRKGSQEQPLEDKCVVDIGRRREAGDRYAVPIGCDVVFAASLAAVGRVGAGEIAAALGPYRAGIE